MCDEIHDCALDGETGADENFCPSPGAIVGGCFGGTFGLIFIYFWIWRIKKIPWAAQ